MNRRFVRKVSKCIYVPIICEWCTIGIDNFIYEGEPNSSLHFIKQKKNVDGIWIQDKRKVFIFADKSTLLLGGVIHESSQTHDCENISFRWALIFVGFFGRLINELKIQRTSVIWLTLCKRPVSQSTLVRRIINPFIILQPIISPLKIHEFRYQHNKLYIFL